MNVQFLGGRFHNASIAAAWHFLGCFIVATFAAFLVFEFWYPFPYSEFSGGRELFFLIITIDVIVGPLLTFIVFDINKKNAELLRDLFFVVFLQIGALSYGLWTVWQARPLFLISEIDRFKVISKASLDTVVFSKISTDVLPGFFSGPLLIGIRDPIDEEERKMVLFESVLGGRDYAERPDFYIKWNEAIASKTLVKSKSLDQFLNKYPERVIDAEKISNKLSIKLSKLRYFPIIARQDWIALLDDKGFVVGFLKGDGF